ncbi:RNA methyltransferase [Rhodospirillaceae bacterium LM-1]|nr:RNA methyltransferase [Rhodospirillaceae bacterium LM-1]
MAQRPKTPQQKHRPTVPEAERDLLRISGLSAVTALVERDPARVSRLFMDERTAKKATALCAKLAEGHKPYRTLDGEELTKLAGTPMHGGILALAKPRTVASFDAHAAKDWAKEGKSIMVLDGVGNPHNLGAIARTLAFFGIERLLLSDHPGQAQPSDAAYRIAEGGLEWLEIIKAERFPLPLKRLKEAGFFVIGTALEAGSKPLAEVLGWARKRPIAFVLGNEETGLPKHSQAECDALAVIPGSGHVQSLNVAATAAIVAFLAAQGNPRRF